MADISAYRKFMDELQAGLPDSNARDRQEWARVIIDRQMDLEALASEFLTNEETALRFSWLLSDIGEQDSNFLGKALPALLIMSESVTSFDFKRSFATYWKLCGIPVENEAEAVDLLFGWLRDSETNVTTRSRALFALFPLTQTYPDLKNELKICLEEQLYRHSKDFTKRAKKILDSL